MVSERPPLLGSCTDAARLLHPQRPGARCQHDLAAAPFEVRTQRLQHDVRSASFPVETSRDVRGGASTQRLLPWIGTLMMRAPSARSHCIDCEAMLASASASAGAA